MGDHDPLALQWAVFFYVDKVFFVYKVEKSSEALNLCNFVNLLIQTVTPTLKMVQRINLGAIQS